MSSIRFEDLKESGGPTVEDGDKVVVHYRIALSEEALRLGDVLETTYGPDIPVELTVTREHLLQGIYQGLLGMRAGGAIRRVFIPSNLAYGERSWQAVPSNADLVAEICVARVSKSNT